MWRDVQIVRRALFARTQPIRHVWVTVLGLDTVESVAHVIRVPLTPVFLLSGIASLLGVLSTRLARAADRVDALAEQLEADGRSIDANYGGGWPTSDEGPTCSTRP
jgi:Protein of unknown function (DUF2721)